MMKKPYLLFILFLVSGVFMGQESSLPDIDPEIVGRWDYLRSVNEDGSEEHSLIGREHYYADGTFMYINMLTNPYSQDKTPGTSEELLSARQSHHSGFGTFKTDRKNSLLKLTLIATDHPEDLGKTFEIKYEINGDTIVFGDRFHFIRVKE